MAVKFQRETMDQWLSDARFILHDHLREADATLDDQLDVNHDFYINLERAKILHIITGRNEKKELIAYWIGILAPNIFYQQYLTASALGMWVRPDYRGFTVYRFAKFLDQYFDSLNAKSIVQHARLNNRFGGILEKLGYHKVEEVYKKVF